MPTTDFDVGLFEMISSLLQEQSSGKRESRRGERHPFQCLQLVAPYDGVHLPGPEALACVQCEDISPNGFSYSTDVKPATRRLIIALGKLPFQFFEAEVVHVRPIVTSNRGRFHVGCRFLRRITGN